MSDSSKTKQKNQVTQGFDFSSGEAKLKDTAILHPKHPVKGKLPVTIEVAGRDSMLYQMESTKYRKDLLKAVRNGTAQELTTEEGSRIMAEFLSSIIISWGGVQWEGKPMECTKENKVRLLKDPAYRWFRDQIDEFTSERKNFLGN